MKRVIAVVVMIALTMNCTYTLKHYADYKDVQPMIISERVGETLDGAERDQFDLFSAISDFESATFYEIGEGGYKVEIMAADQIYAAVNRDSQAVAILRYYIDSYEDIQGSWEAFERKWKIIDYDTLGQPITLNELKNVRRNSYSCGCAGGSWLAQLLPNFLLSFGVIGGLRMNMFGTSGTEFPRPVPAWISFVLINIGTAATGALIGRRLDDKAALNAIKEARQPKKLH